jgi:nitrite reductase/ring-hydroxylating ferredoxin subunit/uncharacterized membrane protein
MAKGIVEAAIGNQEWLDGLAEPIQSSIRGVFRNAGEGGRVVKDLLHGVWLGHPLHPVLTDVPIGAWTVAQVLDLASAAKGGDKNLDNAADWSLGLGMLAAGGVIVTGLADWSESEGKQRRIGLVHGLLNAFGNVFTISSILLRLSGKKENRGLARSLSAVGYLTSATAAYVAGELVYNLGMGISRNAWVEGPEGFTDVGDAKELDDGKMHKYDVEGNPVVLVKHDDGVHAFGGTCSHFGCGLWEGKLEEHTVTCACHGSQFDITDGSLVHGPATDPVPAYEVKEMIGRIYVRLAD